MMSTTKSNREMSHRSFRDGSKLLADLHFLVPRLCLGTHGIAGSACRPVESWLMAWRQEPPKQFIPRQEPGNERGEMSHRSLAKHSVIPFLG